MASERNSKYRSSVIGPPVFQYTSLYVKISEAKNLHSKDMTGVKDVYCYIKVDNESIARTASVFNSSEPFWGEEYRLHVPLEYQNVSVNVYDHDNLGVKFPIGKVRLDRESIMASARGLDKWFPLTPISKDDDIQGELLVEIMIDEYSEEMFRGVITLVEARELVIRDVNSKVDPYAVISYKGKDLTTPVLRKTRFPHWNKTYEMPINRPLEDPDNRTVRITIFDSKFHQDAFLGEVIIDLAELFLGQRYKTWYRLQQQDSSNKTNRDTKKEKDLGSLRLKVQCHEERILDSQLYIQFVQQMLKAVENPSPQGSPLLMMLEEVMTMDRNNLAHTLVRFYIAHNAILLLLDCLVSKEVADTVHSGTLFRGNSLASKCLDQFMKVVALPYLHETLKHVIDTIFNDRKLIELDPDQLKSVSTKTSKTIDTSITQLSNYVQLATDSIFSSVERCPLILRQALKLVWERVISKLSQNDTPYIAVTGFIFLRFFVPAILSPKLFAIRDEHADQRTERTLKLTAKVLQAMGNLQTEVDVKEQFMSPMVTILQCGVVEVKKYVDTLLDVPPGDSTAGPPASPIILSPDGAGYVQHVILNCGVLWKRVTSGASGAVGSLLYRKRYFELTNFALVYYPTEKKTGEAKSYPVQWIKIVEKLDEGAFSRKYMFQVVIVPNGPSLISSSNQVTFYLQAADVNEQNRWVSAIRKACLCNRDMSPVYHTGAYIARKKEWSCCRASALAEPGCCPCHRGITIGDWRDPLDPYLDAQVLYSQYQQGRETLNKNYMTKETSSNGTSNDQGDIDENEPVVEQEDEHQKKMSLCYSKLAEVLDELAYHHSQVPTL